MKGKFYVAYQFCAKLLSKFAALYVTKKDLCNIMCNLNKIFSPTRMGFEPTRAEHIGLAVQRLNHSATSSRWRKRPLKPFLQVSPWVSEDGEVTVEIEEAAEELPKIGAELAMMQMSETFHTKIIIIMSVTFLYVLQALKDLHRFQWHCTAMHFFSTWILYQNQRTQHSFPTISLFFIFQNI